MSAEIIIFNGRTTLDIPAERVISGAGRAELASAVVIGRTDAGELYFAASLGNEAEVLLLLELARIELLKQVER